MNLENPFNSVWVWGNPLISDHPRSYADVLVGEGWGLLREITRSNFHRLRRAWLRDIANLGGTDRARHVAYFEMEARRRQVRGVQQYVARKLNIHQSTVSRILRHINIDAMHEAMSSSAYSPGYLTESIEPEAFEPMPVSRLSVAIECAGKGIPEGWTDGSGVGSHSGCLGTTYRFAPLCVHCKEFFGTDPDTYPAWLRARIKMNYRDHNRTAPNSEQLELVV